MKKTALLGLCTFLTASLSALAQAAQADPLVLLDQVARNYATAGLFHIESVQEQVSGNELRHDWNKTVSKAIRGTGNRFYIEVRSGFGTFIEVSDGTTEWTYQPESKIYVKRPVAASGPTFPRYFTSGGSLSEAWNTKVFLESDLANYKRAALLPEETLEIEGKHYSCYVVHVTSEDRKRQWGGEGYHSDTTYWIDKQTPVLRKSVDHSATFTVMPPIRIPINIEKTVLYGEVDLAPHDPSGVFDFAPPSDAKQVASLDPDSMPAPSQSSQPTLAGQMAPDAQFVGSDGKTVSLQAFRGKPVLLDFWATWCGPCLLSMPKLGQLYPKLKSKGIALVTIDEDEGISAGTEYLARHNFTWQNYHDAQYKLRESFQGKDIPLVVLIDAQGKIAYYSAGFEEDKLENAIGRLGH